MGSKLGQSLREEESAYVTSTNGLPMSLGEQKIGIHKGRKKRRNCC